MKNKTNPSNLGAVVSVRGSVVDIRFDAHLPPIYSLLHAKDGKIAIEVLAQLDAHRVRGIALTPTQGLARGIAVEDTGGPLKAPVGKGILSRMFDVFGNAIDRQAGADRCPMAHGPSSPAAVSAAFHQIRDLRDGDQGHRCAGAARARRQSGSVRRGGRGQDGIAHRNDSQHDRAPEGRQHFLRDRRTMP